MAVSRTASKPTPGREALSRVVAAINQKGGVGKTSLIANIGASYASNGWRVLLVDLDPQGNLGLDLGYRGDRRGERSGDPRYDDGQALAAALTAGTAPLVLDGVREYGKGRLDVIPSGPALKPVPIALGTFATVMKQPYETKLSALLIPLAGDYDIVLIDCPPSDMVLRSLALNAARYALAPTRTDAASLEDGLDSLVGEIALARQGNPLLRLLGIALFGLTVSATRLSADTRRDLLDVTTRWFDDDPYGIPVVFNTAIRQAEAVARRSRQEGKVVAEIAAAAQTGPSPFELMKRRRAGEDVSQIQLAPAATGNVSGDYESLAAEILYAMWQAQGGGANTDVPGDAEVATAAGAVK